MAGKQQHFIPRFLQKGFASRTTKKDAYVWVYQQSKDPFNANTKGVGQKRYFYSDADDTYVDDAITDKENEFSIFCDNVRSGNVSAIELDASAPKLFAHLEVRSKNIRDSYVSTSQVVMDAVFKKVTDPISVENFCRNKLKDDPLDFFDKQIPREGKRIYERKMIANAMRLAVLKSGTLTKISEQLSSFLALKKHEIPELVENAITSGQKKSLRQSVIPKEKVRFYSKFHYFIKKQPNLFLGDSMLVLQVGDGEARHYKTVLSKSDRCLAAFLPIDSETALIGYREGTQIEAENFIEQIASCSHTFFIADRRDTDLDRRVETIGKNQNLISDDELNKIVDEIINDQDFF